MNSSQILEIVVTARPSWTRVKSLIYQYTSVLGNGAVQISLVGPSLSNKYGNIESQMPVGVRVKKFRTLFEDDNLVSVTLTSLEGAKALVNSWEAERPDAILVIADRTETLGVSLAAATMQIPLIHLQGGEVTGSIDDKVRDTNSKLADFHLTTNENTLDNLIKIGEKRENIRVIGCPSIDIVKERISQDIKLRKSSIDYGGVGATFSTSEDYGIIFFHPDTLDLRKNLQWVQELIELTRTSELFWFWFWPNTDHGSSTISKMLRSEREKVKNSNVRYLVNLPPEDFIDLTLKSKILVGNSSFGLRESSFIGLPVINIGARQNGRQRAGNVMDVFEPIPLAQKLRSHSKLKFNSSQLYGCGESGKLGAKAILEWIPMIKTR
jgi:UDP-hydrolysing UDP-N-acetyl-D-glucosamine 2-epimerase